MTSKNKSAVHLGRLSAESRKQKAGGQEEFNKAMKELRSMGAQKSRFAIEP